MICQSWKVMFHAEYSSGQPLRMLVDLRGIVETALSRAASNARAATARPAAQAKAASAAAGSTSEIPEFEISSAPAWDGDGSGNPENGGSA
jgi:hypothetical protein